jgi:hypothetical protein
MDDTCRWFHHVLSTYGAWLPGDSRGFRTRHHREHIEGDYKNPPPPGMYAARQRRSQELMKFNEVFLPVELFAVVGTALREKLIAQGAQVICQCVSAQHLHIQAHMPPEQCRAWLGVAKKHAWFVLRDEHAWTGKLWGKRGKSVPIRDRQHQINVFDYILRHREQGAWVWSIRDEPPQKVETEEP